jgi:hypothetical protein
MSQNFNVTPYFDDFDPSKNFHRILFKPGVAVQARELTQSQTILQSQISKFADSIFSQNTPVTGGKVTTNLNCYYIKLNYQYSGVSISAATFLNKTIQDSTGTILAKVIATAEGTGVDISSGDPPTLVVTYLSGTRFTDGQFLAPSDGTNIAATTIGSAGGTTCTGLSSAASISDGVFYVVNNSYTSSTQNQDGTYSKYSIGNFVSVQPQTIILSKYNNTPSYRIGLNVTDTIVDYTSDITLLDPAIGASNYQAPGSDRYQITLTLSTLPLTLGSDDNFIELVRIDTGVIQKQVDGTVYSVIDDYFAKRTLETNGDYIVSDFALGTASNGLDSSKYLVTVGPGTAYVQGYRIENQSTLKIDANRARTTASANNNSVYIDYGSYLYVDTVRGSSSGFFDTTIGNNAIDLHCVLSPNVVTTNSVTYSSTLAASAYLRNLVYLQNTSDANTLTYVYKAYLYDITTKTLSSNVSSATSSSITFYDTTGKFTSTANAYTNVTLTIDSGTSAGDTRYITSYNSSTKTATVNSPFTFTPDTTSNFSLRFGLDDSESMIYATSGTPYIIVANSAINSLSKVSGAVVNDAYLQNDSTPELIFPLGNPYVANLTSTSYATIQEFRNQAFPVAGTAKTIDISAQSALNFLGNSGTQSADAIKQNLLVVVSTAGANVGEVLSMTTSGRTVSIDATKKILTLTLPDIGSFTATIYVRMTVTNGDDTNLVLKNKVLVNGNTSLVSYTGGTNISNTYVHLANAQVYIANSAVVGYGTKQSLYVSDVKNIVKIIDTKGAAPTVAMLTATGNDVTSYYTFNDGQTDNYYGHASISLIPGAPKPTSLLVVFNYYSHTGGDGYFGPQSYPISDYAYRKTYVSRSGSAYVLKDCLDFRPVQENAQSAFKFKLNQPTGSPIAGSQGVLFPVDLTTFTGNYTYYLGRKDILVLGKDNKFNIVEGSPSLAPFAPSIPSGAMLIANISYDPYTAYIPTEMNTGRISNLSIQPVSHRRWQMKDITDLQTRVNNLEYYTSLNLLEQQASSLQIPDALGLNRFKNGLLVDDFSTFNVGDTFNQDFSASINTRIKKLEPSMYVTNYSLQNAQTLGSKKFSDATLSGLNYRPHQLGNSTVFSLPYTEKIAVNQPLASRTISVNPFAVVSGVGTMELTPPMDNWIDQINQPAILFVDPSIKAYKAVDTVNLLDGSPTLSVNDWQAIPGTEKTVTTTTTVSEGSVNAYDYSSGYYDGGLTTSFT